MFIFAFCVILPFEKCYSGSDTAHPVAGFSEIKFSLALDAGVDSYLQHSHSM